MSDDQTPPRITVSRDALRADLAEMELRLRVYFDEQLKHKADAGAFAEVAMKLDALDRGDFTPVHRRALIDLVEEYATEQASVGWTKKERWLALLSAAVTLSALLLSFIVAANCGSL